MLPPSHPACALPSLPLLRTERAPFFNHFDSCLVLVPPSRAKSQSQESRRKGAEKVQSGEGGLENPPKGPIQMGKLTPFIPKSPGKDILLAVFPESTKENPISLTPKTLSQDILLAFGPKTNYRIRPFSPLQKASCRDMLPAPFPPSNSRDISPAPPSKRLSRDMLPAFGPCRDILPAPLALSLPREVPWTLHRVPGCPERNPPPFPPREALGKSLAPTLLQGPGIGQLGEPPVPGCQGTKRWVPSPFIGIPCWAGAPEALQGPWAVLAGGCGLLLLVGWVALLGCDCSCCSPLFIAASHLMHPHHNTNQPAARSQAGPLGARPSLRLGKGRRKAANRTPLSKSLKIHLASQGRKPLMLSALVVDPCPLAQASQGWTAPGGCFKGKASSPPDGRFVVEKWNAPCGKCSFHPGVVEVVHGSQRVCVSFWDFRSLATGGLRFWPTLCAEWLLCSVSFGVQFRLEEPCIFMWYSPSRSFGFCGSQWSLGPSSVNSSLVLGRFAGFLGPKCRKKSKKGHFTVTLARNV